jgi:hypothetical protein
MACGMTHPVEEKLFREECERLKGDIKYPFTAETFRMQLDLIILRKEREADERRKDASS